MKRPLAALGATALVAASTLVLASPATAATPVGSATFYTTADFGTETDAGYPSTDWFYGALNAPFTQGTTASSVTGLDITTTGEQQVQLLRNVDTTPASAADFVSAVESVQVYASAGDWVFQLPVFGEPGSAFTTLRPATAGTLTGNWITSRPIGASYAAGASGSLDDLVAALYADGAPELLGFGFFIDPSVSVSLYGVQAFGTASAFTPVPTATLAPNPITPTLASTAGKGITATGTGWFPGSEVFLGLLPCTAQSSGDLLYEGTGTAGPDGTVSITFVLDEAPAAGTYCWAFHDGAFLFANDVLGFGDDFVVSAELAATGAEDATPVALVALGVAFAGALMVILGARRRARHQS